MDKIKKQLLILGAVLGSTIPCGFAQIIFQKNYGGLADDIGYAVQQTTDGGFILAGTTQSFGAGSEDAYLIKTDVNGDILWTKTYGGAGHDEFHSVQQTTDGGYIAAGQVEFGAGDTDVYLVRTNAGGDTLWTKAFGGSGDDLAKSVQQTSDGGYIINGNTSSFSPGSAVYLIKTDATGNPIWEKTYGDTAYADIGNSMQQTADGGYIITGQTYSFTGGLNVLLIKTDSNGDTLWTKSFSRLIYTPDAGNSVKQTMDGGYIIAGNTITPGGAGYDGYLIKTDANGDTLWTRSYGGQGFQEFNSIQQTANGGYIIGQTSYGGGNMSAFSIKTDSNGDTLWTKAYGTPALDWGNSIEQTTDGGYVVIGQSMFGVSGWEIYLIKTDSSGNNCVQSPAPVVIDMPPSQIVNTSTLVTSPAPVTTNQSTIVSGGGFVNTLCTTVGITEIATDNSFIISPNPSSGNFTIAFDRKIMEGNIEIVNMTGEIVYTENISNGLKKEINFKNIPCGIYFVKLFDGEHYLTGKIIVEDH